ncbi:MAG: carbamoyl-phosphate synthase domain-containing protein, partial [Pirellula sp.]
MSNQDKRGFLALEDGTVFEGISIGADGQRDGEVCFNTSITGYQEILTDPSYRGQIVTMTYPMIGNVGINMQDRESARPHVAGFIVRENSRLRSNYRSEDSLSSYLISNDVVAIAGIDTRALVRRIRDRGAQRGILSTIDFDHDSLVEKARQSPGLVGRDLVREVVPDSVRQWSEPLLDLSNPTSIEPAQRTTKGFHVVCLDFG